MGRTPLPTCVDHRPGTSRDGERCRFAYSSSTGGRMRRSGNSLRPTRVCCRAAWAVLASYRRGTAVDARAQAKHKDCQPGGPSGPRGAGPRAAHDRPAARWTMNTQPRIDGRVIASTNATAAGESGLRARRMSKSARRWLLFSRSRGIGSRGAVAIRACYGLSPWHRICLSISRTVGQLSRL